MSGDLDPFKLSSEESTTGTALGQTSLILYFRTKTKDVHSLLSSVNHEYFSGRSSLTLN